MVHVVEFRSERSQYAYTFGGVAPVARVAPGSVLKLWSERTQSDRPDGDTGGDGRRGRLPRLPDLELHDRH